MPTIDAVCVSCAQHGPIAIFATLGDGREIALCHRCATSPARLRAFVARYRAASVAPSPAHARPTPPAGQQAHFGADHAAA